jgi:hypothetical protein
MKDAEYGWLGAKKPCRLQGEPRFRVVEVAENFAARPRRSAPIAEADRVGGGATTFLMETALKHHAGFPPATGAATFRHRGVPMGVPAP